MSHLLSRQVPGYKELSDWPLVPPDPMTRQVETATPESLRPLQTSPTNKSSMRSSNEDDELGISDATTASTESSDEDEEDNGSNGVRGPVSNLMDNYPTNLRLW